LERQFFAGVEPPLKDDFAVFGFGDVHGAGALLQLVRHFFIHVDADGLGAFADGICSHNNFSCW